MNKFNFKIKNKEFVFSSDTHRALYHEFLKQVEKDNKEVSVSRKKNLVSDDLRGYYFAAVIPVVRRTCDEWAELNGNELHQVMKKMFNFFETYNPATKRTERFAKPTLSNDEWTNTGLAMQFLIEIGDYLKDCGLEMPDSELYKKEVDSARLINE